MSAVPRRGASSRARDPEQLGHRIRLEQRLLRLADTASSPPASLLVGVMQLVRAELARENTPPATAAVGCDGMATELMS